MNSEVPDGQTRKFRVYLLSSPNPEVPDLKPGSSGFGRQIILSTAFEWKFVGAHIHPPLGDITVLSPRRGEAVAAVALEEHNMQWIGVSRRGYGKRGDEGF